MQQSLTFQLNRQKKKSFPFNCELNLQHVLKERNQVDGKREAIPPMNFIYPLEQQRAQVVTTRTGIQNKELSVQHADNVAFNNLVQWAYDRACFIDSSILTDWLHSSETTSPDFSRPRLHSEARRKGDFQ